MGQRGCCMRQEVEDHILSLWLDFPWAADGRRQVNAFPFFFSLLSLHTPHHAEPVPVTMVTQGEPSRETEACKQKRNPLSHFRNLTGGESPPPPKQRRKWIRDIITQWHLILYYICICFIITFFFSCAGTYESTKVSLHCSTDSKWTSVSLTFMLFFWYLLCTCLF